GGDLVALGAPNASGSQEDPVTGCELAAVDVREARPCGLGAQPVGVVVAALGVDVVAGARPVGCGSVGDPQLFGGHGRATVGLERVLVGVAGEDGATVNVRRGGGRSRESGCE